MAILIGLSAIAHKWKLPHPILLVAAGLVIGFVPQLPDLALDPNVVFVTILPPLLYDAASRTSWHEFRTAIRPISTLAVSLVFFTTMAVAATAHFLIPGFTWPLAFVLGAVVSPPDAVAASGIIKGLGLSRKTITIIEGESLVNDASALVAYRYAVLAVTTGSFVWWHAGLQFLLVAGVGILIGVTIGYMMAWIHKMIDSNPIVETALTLLAPFLAYLAAEHFHMSGVLSVVSAGLVMAWKSPETFSYQTRMRTRVVWDTLIFLLHGFVFILIGLQLPFVIKGLGNYPFWEIFSDGLLVSLVTIVVRIIWVLGGAYIQGRLDRHHQKRQPQSTETVVNDQTWKNVLVVAWTGTRGVISLATALALPLLLDDGSLFPKRHSIIFLSFVVIFITLVVQGLSLPLLIRLLKIDPQDNTEEEHKELQLYMANNTLHFMENDFPLPLAAEQKEKITEKYHLQVQQLTKAIKRKKRLRMNSSLAKELQPDPLLDARQEITKFQRQLLIKAHKEGEFSDAAIRKVERELDVDEMKLDLQLPKEPTQL